jgi:hypothetical protein
MPTVEFSFSWSRFMRIFMTVLLAGPGQSSIRVDGDSVRVKMGFGGWTFSADVPRSSIIGAEQISTQVWAWGAHGWKGRWLVNGSSDGLVCLTLQPATRARTLGFPLRVRELTLSLAEPEDFVRTLALPAH